MHYGTRRDMRVCEAVECVEPVVVIPRVKKVSQFGWR